MKQAALISVSDRTDLLQFAKGLQNLGLDLLTTSGTGKTLTEAGLKTIAIEEYTGQKEILDGRVKTLHPRIHAGLLAKRSNPAHLAELEADKILPIKVAVVNLYPFDRYVTGEESRNPNKMIELIDVGGPTMIRAAAKNFESIYAVIDPSDYERVLQALSGELSGQGSGLALRRELSAKVFSRTAAYDLAIARYFSNVEVSENGSTLGVASSGHGDFPPVTGQVLTKLQDLRYGENPHQSAGFYGPIGRAQPGFEQLNGKELSYNNLLDFDAASRMISSLPGDKPAVVIVKHLNPCGAALGIDLIAALKSAKRSDPRSHFGGVLAFNQTVEAPVAEMIREDFAEIVLAPDYSAEALDILKKSKNLRVLKVALGAKSGLEWRSVGTGILIQESDKGIRPLSEAEVVSARKPSAEELVDLTLAWTMCAHIKSNAICLAKNGFLIGVGAGQMSRIDSVEVALHKARTHQHELSGSVAASDAFFPFPDCVEVLAQQGISAILAPRGAKRDNESIDAANKHGISLLFVEDRHFRH